MHWHKCDHVKFELAHNYHHRYRAISFWLSVSAEKFSIGASLVNLSVHSCRGDLFERFGVCKIFENVFEEIFHMLPKAVFI